MKLKFIGRDDSMGLTHGKVYNVDVLSRGKYIWVRMVFGKWECPYSSPQTFAANWQLPF